MPEQKGGSQPSSSKYYVNASPEDTEYSLPNATPNDVVPELSDVADGIQSPKGPVRVGAPRATDRQAGHETAPDISRGAPSFAKQDSAIEIGPDGRGVDKEYLKKMEERERGKQYQGEEYKAKSKEMTQDERKHENKVQSFMQKKTEDTGLQHRQAALKTMEQVGERDTRGAQHKTYEEGDKEMLNAMDQVKQDMADKGQEGIKDTMQMIEEQLVVGNGFWARLQYMKRQEERRRERPEFVHPFPKLQRIVTVPAFEAVVMVFMLTNAVTLALSAERHPGGLPLYLIIMEHCFTFIFMVEIGMRVAAHGWPWILDFYNMCDVALVFLTGVLVMWILEPAGVSSDFMRNFSILRLLRLLKMARAIRAIPAFNLMWRMLRAFLVSGRLLFWSIIDFIFLAFLFGIFFCVLVGKDDNLIHDDTVGDLFGTVPRSMLSALQVSTRCHWADIVRHVRDRNSWAWPTAIFCIISVNFVLFNLVTAVVIQTVFVMSAKDADIERRLREHKRVKQWKLLKSIFKAMDIDGTGQVTAEELDEAMRTNLALQRKLNEINLNKAELADLWLILDTSGDGELDIDEFLDGMRQMEGSAKSYDMVRNNTRTKTLMKRIRKLGEFVFAIAPEAKRLNSELDRLHNKMMDVFTAVRPMEKEILSIVRLLAEEFNYNTDEYGMPTLDLSGQEMGAMD
ncbi:unnamed protein product [Amoebophrya sp. A120]|nr:unnamed protein product [Amoebophrya sp. A120]|eukprot:GSA120T00010476001.1